MSAPQLEYHDGRPVILGLGRTEFLAQGVAVGHAGAAASLRRVGDAAALASEEDATADDATAEEIAAAYARSDRAERDRHRWEDQ